MLPSTPELLAALQDSHAPIYVAQAFYGPELTLESVPLDAERGSISFAADGQIQTSATVYVTRDGNGNSLVPRAEDDPLAPYGQEISISRRIPLGEDYVDIPCGRFPIKSVPDMREYFRARPRRDTVDAQALTSKAVLGFDLVLRLTDRFDWIREANFLIPEAPKSTSTWAEIQRLSPIPIVRNAPDVALPPSLTYTDSRYAALVTLFANLSGVPHLTRQGALTWRPQDPWVTETVERFTIDGTIDVGEALSSTDVYNAVRVRSSSGDSEIIATAEITAPDNPFRVGGPFNGGAPRVFTKASPLIVTQAQADADALTTLARVSTREAQSVTIRHLPNPLLEIGDYGRAIDYRTRRFYTGSISRMTLSLNPLEEQETELTLATSGDLP